MSHLTFDRQIKGMKTLVLLSQLERWHPLISLAPASLVFRRLKATYWVFFLIDQYSLVKGEFQFLRPWALFFHLLLS